MIKISFTKIRDIYVNDLVKVLNLMSAAIPLPTNVTIDHSGNIIIPGININTIIIAIDGSRKKICYRVDSR